MNNGFFLPWNWCTGLYFKSQLYEIFKLFHIHKGIMCSFYIGNHRFCCISVEKYILEKWVYEIFELLNINILYACFTLKRCTSKDDFMGFSMDDLFN